MNSDPSETATSMVSDMDGAWTELESTSNGESSERKNLEDQIQDPESDPLLMWDPSGRHLLSGLLGLNIVLLGTALVAGQAFNPMVLKHQEPQVFLLLLMVCSMVWMLWYLLWTRRQPGVSPLKDHHAGGAAVTVVLMLFAMFSLLLHVFRIGYLIFMRACKPIPQVLIPFIEAPFLGLQTYLLWAHSKDCVHRYKIITRSGLIVTLCADLLLWLNAVTDDTIHQEIELEKEEGLPLGSSSFSESGDPSSAAGMSNATVCPCAASGACIIFRKGYEILYPFTVEYYLMAGCMLYVMWKNVGRRTTPSPHEHVAQKLTLRIVYRGGIFVGPFLGFLVLIAGLTIFIFYQVWVGQRQHRFTAFLMFYGYHLTVIPIMSLCSLAGMLIHKVERRAEVSGHNPTRSLDVILLVGAALGQLALSYFSMVAALALGTNGTLGSLDLSYSLLSLLELMLQNIFIINGLHRHPSLSQAKKRGRQRSVIFKENTSTAPPADQDGNGKRSWAKRATREICAFLILSNIMLWIIPAFGAHPQFENGLGKQFFGLSAWFVLVNLGQPLEVFYRMHSVGALMELIISA